MSTLTAARKASLEISFEVSSDRKQWFLTFAQVLPEKPDEEFPSWPWPDMVHALGFFHDVIVVVDREVKQFRDECQGTKTVGLKFKRRQPLLPSDDHLRCANAWLKIDKDLPSGTLTIELQRVPGTYKDFVLLDVLDHLEGRAGRGKNKHVDGRPGVLRQKLECALQYGPHILYDRAFRPEPIPTEERVRTDED